MRRILLVVVMVLIMCGVGLAQNDPYSSGQQFNPWGQLQRPQYGPQPTMPPPMVRPPDQGRMVEAANRLRERNAEAARRHQDNMARAQQKIAEAQADINKSAQELAKAQAENQAEYQRAISGR